MSVCPVDFASAAPFPLRSDLGLALQGGGAYGAFTWGVLDRLLEEPSFRPVAISGASAGAINAVVMAAGLRKGGRQQARDDLETLWRNIARMTLFRLLEAPGAPLQLDLMTRLLSPYQFNPLNINPLRQLLTKSVDFRTLAAPGKSVALFISATNVRTGAPRIFREDELDVEVLLASACLPYLHHSVEIDGESYWDGGFSANPPILPLILDTKCNNVLLIRLMPETEAAIPTQAQPIFARMRRLMFNAPLNRDLEALSNIQARLKRTNMRLPRDMARLRSLELETVAMPAQLLHQDRVQAYASLIERMRFAGRAAADSQLRA